MEVCADDVCIYVDDDGAGMDESLGDDAFKPFVRSADSPGVGLGLAITKRIVSQVGGRVSVLRSPLGGCRMQLSLPRSSG